MTPTPIKVRDLGEIAIRCENLDLMANYYRDVIGLEELTETREDGIVFFKISEGFAGHTTILALFRPDAGRPNLHPQTTEKPVAGKHSSLHHLALSVAFEDQEGIMEWFDEQTIKYRVQTFDWVGWRGIFTEDPEGNTVELVAAHPSLKVE